MNVRHLIVAGLATAACGDAAREAPGAGAVAGDTAAAAGLATATAVLRDSAGRELGTLTLASAPNGITVEGRLAGLPPGEHGMHLHEVGVCEPPAFASAGRHWNPTGAPHGSHTDGGPHLGDLPNFTVGDDSAAAVRGMTAGGSLAAPPALLDADGAAVIVHAGPDDYASQPSGGSGTPIACGVIEAEPAAR